MSYLPYHFLNFEIGTCYRVLSDECEPVSVDRKFQEFMQHRVAATQQEQLHVEPYMFL